MTTTRLTFFVVTLALMCLMLFVAIHMGHWHLSPPDVMAYKFRLPTPVVP